MTNSAVLLNEGMTYLTEKLGMVEAERFIVLLNSEPFDYTRWRNNLFEDIPLEQLYTEAEKHWNKTHPVS